MVARAKAGFRVGRVKVHRPWVAEPGRWSHNNLGDGPVIAGRKTVLFRAWLAWSRYPGICLRDRIAVSDFAAVHVTLRRLGEGPDLRC